MNCFAGIKKNEGRSIHTCMCDLQNTFKWKKQSTEYLQMDPTHDLRKQYICPYACKYV